MDAPAQAQFAASIAQGAGKAQGASFVPVELETRISVPRVKYANLVQEKEADSAEKQAGDKELTEGVKSSAGHMEEASDDEDDDVPLVE